MDPAGRHRRQGDVFEEVVGAHRLGGGGEEECRGGQVQ